MSAKALHILATASGAKKRAMAFPWCEIGAQHLNSISSGTTLLDGTQFEA